MARFDFCGGSYTAQAVNADCQRCVNFYPEVNESGSGRSKMALMPTPGLAQIASLEAAPRGQLEYNGRLFVVAGTKLYEITQTASGTGVPITVTATALNGTIPLANDGLPASLAANQTQLLIASGGSVYLLVLATNAFSQVAASNFTLPSGPAPVIQVAFCSSFFLALMANSQTIGISNVLDGGNWNLNGQIVVSKFPDNVVGMVVDHDQVWLRGRKKSAVYFASGSLNVFDYVPGSMIEQGGAAPFAASPVDNSLFWLGGDDKGDAVAWRATGYNAARISTHAVEYAWQRYPKRSDAVSYAYQRFGHTFWVVLFPSANNGNGATWVYDVASGLWHERDFLNITSGASLGHPSWNHAFWNGTHIVGDWRTSNLYQMDESFYDNAGVPIIRIRRAPHISTEVEVMRHSRFELDMETGVSSTGQAPVCILSSTGVLWQIGVNDTGNLTTTKVAFGTPQVIKLNDSTIAATWQVGIDSLGRLTTTSITLDATQPVVFPIVSNTKFTVYDLGVTLAGLLQTTKLTTGLPTVVLNNGAGPYVWLRWSDDGGHTWSNAQQRSAGTPGAYKQIRLRWQRLGRARIRTYEISCSEPVPVRLVDAYVNAQPGYAPSERLPKQYAKVA